MENDDGYMFGRKRRRSEWLGGVLGAGLGAGSIAAGSAFGQPALGTAFAPVANRIGMWGGDLIKTFTGFGSYNVAQNSLYEGAQAPFIRNYDVSGGLVVSHREYVCDIVSSATPGAYRLQSFTINPANSLVFEFLAQIAVNYEQYICEGIIFTYKPTSAESGNSTTGNVALGTVMMATQYNVLLPDFQSKAELMSSQYSMTCRPSEAMMHPIECAPSASTQTHLYISPGGVLPANADQRLYDFARVQIASQGLQSASQVIGELHVSYQFALLKPRLYSALGRADDYWYGRSTTAIANNMLLSPLPGAIPNNIFLPFTSSVNVLTFTFPAYPQPTSYFVSFGLLLNVAAAAPTITFTATNCFLGTVFPQSPPPTVVTAANFAQALITTDGNTLVPTVTITLSSWPANRDYTLVVVQQVPNP